jgi:hypothetical protein
MADIERAAAAWLSCQARGDGPPVWVVELTMHCLRLGHYAAMWRFVLLLCAGAAPDDSETIEMIGVGPLFSMITRWPEATLASIEAEVDSNPTLLRSLAVGITSMQPARQRLDAIVARCGGGSG